MATLSTFVKFLFFFYKKNCGNYFSIEKYEEKKLKIEQLTTTYNKS